MRLWHQNLIPLLPRQQILGQHRENCALRGLGWGKNHATINYIFKYDLEHLFAYHSLVMDEMKRRGYNVDENWLNPLYRGKRCSPIVSFNYFLDVSKTQKLIYPEHNDLYLKECLDNLRLKGIDINYK